MKKAVANIFPVISTDNNIITYSNTGAPQADGAILFSSFKPNTQYTLVLTYSKSTNVYTHIAFLYSDGSFTMHNRVAPDNPNTKTTEVYVSKVNKTLTAIIRKADEYSNVTLYCDESGLFEGVITKSEFEPYRGEKVDYKFGVLGKNKFNWDVPVSESSPVASDSSTAREFTLDTYVIGMSVNNYYRHSYDNWVLNPSVENGVISFSSGGASGYGIAFPLKLASGQTYFLSGTGNGSTGATYYDENGELISFQNGRLNKTITVPENAVTTLIGFYASTTNTDFEFSNIQLELGSTATAYEPYNQNKTVYGGWVDLVSGEVQQEYGIMHLDETNNWTGYANAGVKTRVYLDSGANAIASAAYATVPSVSNKFVSQGQNGYPDENKFCFSNTTEGRMFLGLSSSITSLEDFKTWFGNLGGADFAYELITPITYFLVPTELQTFLGQNNVWSNADYVEVEYDLHETQDILVRKQFIIANQPHTKAANGDLISFETDMAATLKEGKVYAKPIQNTHGYKKAWIGGSGKNLFNINATEHDPSDVSVANTTIRIFTPGTYTSCASWSNWRDPARILDYSISNNKLTVNSTTGYGVGFALEIKPETQYAVSCNIIGNGGHVNIAYYDATGNYLTGKSDASDINNTIVTTPKNAAIAVLVFIGSYSETPVTFSNIQFEKGTVVTSYETYENICTIEGWNEIVIHDTGKNLAWFQSGDRTTSSHYNGWSGWSSSSSTNDYWKIPDRSRTYTYSAYIDNRNGESDGCVKIWYRNKENDAYEGIISGSIIPQGEEGWSTITCNGNNNRFYAGLGLDITSGAIARNGMIELGNNRTVHEPYRDNAIIINLPSTFYGGYINLKTGEIWENYYYFDLTEQSWQQYSPGDSVMTISCFPGMIYYRNQLVCNILPPISNPNVLGVEGVDWYNNRLNLCLSTSRGISSQEEFISWLQELKSNGTTPVIVAKMRTPTLAGTISIAQLKTLKGLNNIWSNTSEDVDLKYYLHTGKTIEQWDYEYYPDSNGYIVSGESIPVTAGQKVTISWKTRDDTNYTNRYVWRCIRARFDNSTSDYAAKWMAGSELQDTETYIVTQSGNFIAGNYDLSSTTTCFVGDYIKVRIE